MINIVDELIDKYIIENNIELRLSTGQKPKKSYYIPSRRYT